MENAWRARNREDDCGISTPLPFNHQGDQRGTPKPLPGAAIQTWRKIGRSPGKSCTRQIGMRQEQRRRTITSLHLLRSFSIKNYFNRSCNTHKAHFVEFTNSSTRHPIHRLSNVIFCTMHSCRSCQTSFLLLIQIISSEFHSNFSCQILFFHLLSPHLHPRQSFYVLRLFY